ASPVRCFRRRPNAGHARPGQSHGIGHLAPAGDEKGARLDALSGIQKEDGPGAERSGPGGASTGKTRAPEDRRAVRETPSAHSSGRSDMFIVIDHANEKSPAGAGKCLALNSRHWHSAFRGVSASTVLATKGIY